VNWFESAFGRRYLDLYAHRDGEEARRALTVLFPGHSLAGRRVLDLACGTGRYLRVLYERGARAVGIDLSEVLLEEARRVFASVPARPPLVRADMRRLPFAEATFDLTLSMFTSFGYFEGMEEHAALAVEIGRVTRTLVVVDVLNPTVLENMLRPRSHRMLDGVVVEEDRWLEENPRRVVKRIRIGESEEYDERVQLFTPDELAALFEPAGFSLERVAGDYEGNDFAPASSPRIVARLRRRENVA
jgi:SAM-dependent methyltransferase